MRPEYMRGAKADASTREYSWMSPRTGAALSTELSIDSEEFDNYEIFVAPVSFAFHLREFSVRTSTTLRTRVRPNSRT